MFIYYEKKLSKPTSNVTSFILFSVITFIFFTNFQNNTKSLIYHLKYVCPQYRKIPIYKQFSNLLSVSRKY